jgi:acyl carrier protein
MNDVDQKVIEIIARVTRKEPDGIKPEQQLVADLAIDSPKALELLCALEDDLKIEVPEDAVARINTVADILALVAACRRSAAD